MKQLFKKNQSESPEKDFHNQQNIFLLEIAREFIDINSSDIKNAITVNLKEILYFTGTDRAYIYLFSKDKKQIELKYHFYKSEVKDKIEIHDQVDSHDFEALINPLINHKVVSINSNNSLPHNAYTIKSIMDVEKTKSMILAPLIDIHNVIGFVGIDSTEQERSWLKQDETFIQGCASIFMHVLNRIRLEEQSINAEKKLKTLFDKINDVVFVASTEGKFLEINPAGTALLGYKSDEDIKSVDFARDLYVEPEEWIKFKHSMKVHGFVKDYEAQLKRKDGTVITVIETATSIKDPDGNITAYEGIIRDVTDRRKLEHQLFQSQKMESIGMLAGGIAHDFNNILTAILGYSDMILLKITGDSPIYKEATAIHNSSKRAENLVRQLLGFSRKQMISPKVININEVISELYKMLTRLISAEIELRILTASRLRYVLADPTQIQQILVNLVVNAGHAIKNPNNKNRKKIIVISTDNVYIDKEFIKNNPEIEEGKYVMFSVKDNGIGMNPATLLRIFEPFFTTKGEDQGTGLGLSTVYGIVKQNNGSIFVDSKEGLGTEFRVYWPVTQEESLKENIMESEIRFTNQPTKTIMVVEDDPEVRDLAGNALKRIGYKVFTAENGLKAWNMIKKENLASKIDLLFSDIVMPEMGGDELVEKVLSLNSDIKILLSSGYTHSQVFHKKSDDESYSFLFKPYTVKKLEKAVRMILNNN